MIRASESRKIAIDYASSYETLRAYAIERHAPPSRDGLVILLRHGVAAWMDAWSKLPARRPQPAQADPHKLLPISDNTSVDVIHVLATMTLSHFQELYP